MVVGVNLSRSTEPPAQQQPATTTSVISPVVAPPLPGAAPYVVQAGETLERIATAAGVTVDPRQLDHVGDLLPQGRGDRSLRQFGRQCCDPNSMVRSMCSRATRGVRAGGQSPTFSPAALAAAADG